MSSQIVQAIKQLAEEKGLTYESVLATVEEALAAAYRKDFGDKIQNLKVEYNPETSGMRVFDEKIVVENNLEDEYLKEQAEREEAREKGIILEKKEEPLPVPGEPEVLKFHPKYHLSLRAAKEIKPDAELGETIRRELEVPSAFGRMAAQTAKQVIIQKMREAERNVIFDEFKDKEHKVVVGTVGRTEGRLVFVDIGRAQAVMMAEDQLPGERYVPGERIKVFVASVNQSVRGPQVIVSRARPEIVTALFESEIPEIQSGVVQIKAIAREAGARTKVAVSSTEANVDPIGSVIGQRGTRIQTIISEMGGEKIDVILWSDDPTAFITHSLSPAKILKVDLNESEKSATVYVAPDQVSLAIGRGGQNVRLAARLTGWKISVAQMENPEAPVAVEAVASEETVKSEEAVKPVEAAPEPEKETKPAKKNKKTKE